MVPRGCDPATMNRRRQWRSNELSAIRERDSQTANRLQRDKICALVATQINPGDVIGD